MHVLTHSCPVPPHIPRAIQAALQIAKNTFGMLLLLLLLPSAKCAAAQIILQRMELPVPERQLRVARIITGRLQSSA